MEIMGRGLMESMIVALLSILAAAGIVHVSARIASVEEATFGKALKVSVASIIVGAAFHLLSWWLRFRDSLISIIIAIILTILILKHIYDTGWGRALLVWIIQSGILVILAFAAAYFMRYSTT